jgi:sensor histidine kinase YesM
VCVRAERRGDALELEVSDDGPGFGANEPAAGPRARARGVVDGARSSGVGLANTRERLVLLYGAAASLECGDGPGGGGSVRIRIPWRTVPAAGAGA